ncbi:MAG TPA: hypothetical protein VM406_09250 [Noviherbaspirillum sp.]|nr:hypothetical protein [Noviherbaspirillum sp.]
MKAITCISLAALLAGCATSTTPNYDARFGDAVREARARMTFDPQAGTKDHPVAGLDGPSAAEAVGRYQDTYKAPPPVTNVINIGGSISSGR